jgi:hypothetical protein
LSAFAWILEPILTAPAVPRPGRIAPGAAAVFLLLCLGAPGARAQEIRGTVVDDVSGANVPGAAVLLIDLEGRVLGVDRSREDGGFLLRSAAGDTVRVRVERSGYEPTQTKPWLLNRGSVLEMEVRLEPAPVVLDTLTVTGAWRSRNRASFERHRRSEAWGKFVGPERLATIRIPRASTRLSAFIPGLTATADGVVTIRRRGAVCVPRLYIDGTRFPGDVSLDAMVQGGAIRAVEYYADPLQAPGELSIGQDLLAGGSPTGAPGGMRPPCAILVLWTDAGFGEAGSGR